MDERIPTRVRRDPLWFISWFISRLASAFYELVLIILLLAHSLLSYLVYSFARYCKLQIPCMLCAHVNRKKQFFDKELICDVHKLEVSSLAYCHSHQCLAFARDMCDGCIRSYLDEFVQNPDDGKIGDDMTKVPLLKEESEARRCSCCSIPYRNRPFLQILLRSKQTDEVSSHSVVPVIKENCSKPLVIINSGDILSHIGYNEVKITSDTESEVLVSEEIDRKSFSSRRINDVKEELLSRCIQGSISKNLTELDTNGKLISDSKVNQSQATTNIGHGLEEINWNQVQLKPNVCTSEITSEPVPVEYPRTKFDPADKSNFASNGDVTKSSNLQEVSLKTNPITNDRPKVPIPCIDSSHESLNEIEGESEIDRLKRQIEMDKKSMSALYKELEEERNASAIAANQAMAMINRLQEEKASMQMEALQYLRMMDEQTEYDQEALQKLNDLLADKDEEIQDLETMVDNYRMQSGEEPLPERGTESFDSIEGEFKEYTPVSTPRFVRSRGRDVGKALVRNTVLDFEDEKVCISECLRKLERKVKILSKKMETSGNNEDEIEKLQSTPSFKTIPLSIKQAFKESKLRSISYNDRQGLMGGKSNDASELKNEISELRSKLEALEEDRNFLEHAVNSLRNGSNGIQFIQEIACHLREFRNFGSRQQE